MKARTVCLIPDSKVYGANMEPIWGRQDPGGPHVGPMNFAIWDPSGIQRLWVEEAYTIQQLRWTGRWCDQQMRRKLSMGQP